MNLIRRAAQQMFADLIEHEVERRTAARVAAADAFAREVQADDARLRARIEALQGDLAIASAALERRDPDGLRDRLAVANLAVEIERERADRLYEDLERLRTGERPARLSTDERRELHLLREQNRALEERLNALTVASMERDLTGVTP